MGQILDAAVQMHGHAPRVVREVSHPPPKAQVAPLSSHPPAPYLANLSRGPRASTPASAPKLRQASLAATGGTKTSLSLGRRCGQEGATSAPPSSYHKTVRFCQPFRVVARPRHRTPGSFPVITPRTWWLLLSKPRPPAGKLRPTCPRTLPCAPRCPC